MEYRNIINEVYERNLLQLHGCAVYADTVDSGVI